MDKSSRAGRPPRVGPDDIVEAALEIGLDRANIRNVAASLNMSPTGLYRHVRSQEQLVDLVVTTAFGKIMQDAPDQVSFVEFVLFHAREMFEFFSRHPDGIRVIYSGFVPTSRAFAPVVEKILARGVRAGLTNVEAYEIWARIMAVVLGAAVAEAADRALGRTSLSFLSTVGSVLGDEDSSPELRSLMDVAQRVRLDHFESVRILIDGLRVRFGERLAE